MAVTADDRISLQAPEAFFNRELSWLRFARRVLELAADDGTPLLERVKFVGILGMLHDEFFMKRISGLKRQVERGVDKLSLDGRSPAEELRDCRAEILAQTEEMSGLVDGELRPALAREGVPILDWPALSSEQQASLEADFTHVVLPVLTPLAVDAEHPFPFISNLGLNLAIRVYEHKRVRFVRLKVPANRPRWVGVPDGAGFVALEQIIAANLGLLFPKASRIESWMFRLTRGADGATQERPEIDDSLSILEPGSIVEQVAHELKARRFAGEVRLQVDGAMPGELLGWLAEQLGVGPDDVYPTSTFLGLADLMRFEVEGRAELRDPPYRPVTHPRLEEVASGPPARVFAEMRRGDILLHHPYHSFDTSVLRFIEAAAADERVLAIKLTIYRTSSDSPIVRALLEASRRGKQVAVLVEITARFDEAPNIAWGRLLENEGVHVCYGVEKLKTHVKLALVVREEADGIHRYVHVGTGNYHTGTARAYEDLGMLSADPRLADEVAAVFNELTGATPYERYRTLLVAPHTMRSRFLELIRREAEHAAAGRASGIRAKMNQLQDPELIRELYQASRAGVPVVLNVRGLCCLRPGVPGLSETIRVFSTLGRFLEHGRIYRFHNDGDPVVLIGSADWMKRNLNHRVETVAPVVAAPLKAEVDRILDRYEDDNHSAWDLLPDGSYVRRRPRGDEPARPAQQVFMRSTGSGVLGDG